MQSRGVAVFYFAFPMPLAVGLFQCAGVDRKNNWLLVRHVPGAKRCVVFFPGDISDHAAAGGGQYPQIYPFSLEGLLWVLCAKFPEDTVVLVKPHMMIKFFAAFVNFMIVDSTGCPRSLESLRLKPDAEAQPEACPCSAAVDEEPSAGYVSSGAASSTAAPCQRGPLAVELPRAAAHLEALLASLEAELGEKLPGRRVLAGFSKGAAVLTALFREARKETDFWARCDSVHLLDPGLVEPGTTFDVDSEELRALVGAAPDGFAVWLHSTPRQLQDAARPWLAEEMQAFSERCSAAGVRLERRFYADGRPVSIEMHFDSIRCFAASSNDADSGDKHCGFFADWGAAA